MAPVNLFLLIPGITLGMMGYVVLIVSIQNLVDAVRQGKSKHDAVISLLVSAALCFGGLALTLKSHGNTFDVAVILLGLAAVMCLAVLGYLKIFGFPVAHTTNE